MNKKSYMNICSQPWENMIVSARGGYSACCGGYVIGEFSPDQDIDDVWNNEKISKLRENLLNGTPDGFCQNCAYYKTVLNSALIEGNREYDSIYQPYPKRIELYLTEKCNLKCFMCSFTEDFPNRSRDCIDLPIEQFRRLAEKYFTKIEAINTNCGGEIFMYEHFDEYIEILEKYKPGFVNTNSNGSIIASKEIWEKIMRTHNLLCFSVDAAEPMLHGVIRGFDMQNVFDNIKLIDEINSENKYDFKYGFNFVIMKHNIHQMYDFVVNAINKWGGKHIGFLHITGHAFEKETVLEDREWRILYNNQLKIINEFRKYNNFEMSQIDYCYDENGEIEGENMKKIVKEKESIIDAIRKNALINVGDKLDKPIVFKFKEYELRDDGPILYFMNKEKDPVVALIKKGLNLFIHFHNGTDWVSFDSGIKCDENLIIRIEGYAIKDVHINDDKFVDIDGVLDMLSVYDKVDSFMAHNEKYPDPEPRVSKMEKFIEEGN